MKVNALYMSNNPHNEIPIFYGDLKDLQASRVLRTLGESALDAVSEEPLVQQQGDRMIFPAYDHKGRAIQSALTLASRYRESLDHP